MCRGVRGATLVDSDDRASIVRETEALLAQMLGANVIDRGDIAAILLTSTEDLLSAFPAEAVHELDLKGVPLMCAQEIPVPGGLPRCIRVLILWNTSLSQDQIAHKYLRGAVALASNTQSLIRRCADEMDRG